MPGFQTSSTSILLYVIKSMSLFSVQNTIRVYFNMQLKTVTLFELSKDKEMLLLEIAQCNLESNGTINEEWLSLNYAMIILVIFLWKQIQVKNKVKKNEK